MALSLPWHALSRRGRGRIIVQSAVRSLGFALGLLLAYLIVTLFDPEPVGAVFRLIGGIVLVAVVVWWQLRSIRRTAYPNLQATEAVILSFWLLIIIFAASYVAMSQLNPASFNQQLDQVGGIYFAITTLSTVGFGDIHPVTSIARIIVSLQMILDLALLGVVVRLFITTARSRNVQE